MKIQIFPKSRKLGVCESEVVYDEYALQSPWMKRKKERLATKATHADVTTNKRVSKKKANWQRRLSFVKIK
jgi:hypothetical protein